VPGYGAITKARSAGHDDDLCHRAGPGLARVIATAPRASVARSAVG
jgi:hypothetical protein